MLSIFLNETKIFNPEPVASPETSKGTKVFHEAKLYAIVSFFINKTLQ